MLSLHSMNLADATCSLRIPRAAAATATLQGNYYGVAPYLISVQDGLEKYTTVNYAQGCDVACASNSGFDGE
jgi:hypothetical protein